MTWSLQKRLRVTITLQNGQFSGGGNSLTISDLRMSAKLTVVDGDVQSSLQRLEIYGLSLSQMNQLSIVGNSFPMTVATYNRILIEAGDTSGNFNTVFYGVITSSYADLNRMPEGCFVVEHASPLGYIAKQRVAPTTVRGYAKASSLFQTIAQKAELKLENSGVDTQLRNPYLHGSPVSQIKQLAKAVNCCWFVEHGTTLAIWKPSEGRQSSSPTTVVQPPQMIGYPSFDSATCWIDMQFDPTIKFGQIVKVNSSLTSATGTWRVVYIELELDSMTPHGKWLQRLGLLSTKASAYTSGN